MHSDLSSNLTLSCAGGADLSARSLHLRADDIRAIHLPPGVHLEKLFRDPCPGIRKQLKIGYMVRGFSGTLRLDEHPMNHLRASLRTALSRDAFNFDGGSAYRLADNSTDHRDSPLDE